MTRTKRIEVRVSDKEKRHIQERAEQLGSSDSLSGFLRSLGLSGQLDGGSASALSTADLESRIALLQSELFALKFLLEAELGVSLSRLPDDINQNREPIAFQFAAYAEKLRRLYLDIQGMNIER